MRISMSIIASALISLQAFAMDNNVLFTVPDKVIDIPVAPLTVSKRHPNRRTIFCPECKECPLQKMLEIKRKNSPFQGSWCANCDASAYEKAKQGYEAQYKEGKSKRAYVSTEFEKNIKAYQTRADRVLQLRMHTSLTDASEYDAQHIVSQDQCLSVGTDTSKVVFNTPDELERKRKIREAAETRAAKKRKEDSIQQEKLRAVLMMHFALQSKDKGVIS